MLEEDSGTFSIKYGNSFYGSKRRIIERKKYLYASGHISLLIILIQRIVCLFFCFFSIYFFTCNLWCICSTRPSLLLSRPGRPPLPSFKRSASNPQPSKSGMAITTGEEHVAPRHRPPSADSTDGRGRTPPPALQRLNSPVGSRGKKNGVF